MPCNVALHLQCFMENSLHWLDVEIGQNTIGAYLTILAILIGLFALRKVVSKLLSRLLFWAIRRKPQSNTIQTFVQLLTKPFEWLLTLVVLYYSFSRLNIPHAWELTPSDQPGLLMFAERLFRIALIASFTFFIVRLVDFFVAEYVSQQENNEDALLDKQLLPFLKELLKIFIVIIAFFFSLGFVFDLNIANIIAGLGLGGLAVALAAKESLENLFASFTIFLDKPFVVGDLVTVNGITGSIEKVGFRSTRIRTLEKSFVTLPNKLMIDNTLDNLTLRTHRRADYRIALEYGTPKENLIRFVAEVQAMFASHPKCSEESLARFVDFGESSLNVRVLYFVETMDFAEYLKIKEEINLGIIDIAARCNCKFAFPTRTLFLASGSGLPEDKNHA